VLGYGINRLTQEAVTCGGVTMSSNEQCEHTTVTRGSDSVSTTESDYDQQRRDNQIEGWIFTGVAVVMAPAAGYTIYRSTRRTLRA
jgi:hypothetical protein